MSEHRERFELVKPLVEEFLPEVMGAVARAWEAGICDVFAIIAKRPDDTFMGVRRLDDKAIASAREAGLCEDFIANLSLPAGPGRFWLVVSDPRYGVAVLVSIKARKLPPEMRPN